jgi:hypothetical protein
MANRKPDKKKAKAVAKENTRNADKRNTRNADKGNARTSANGNTKSVKVSAKDSKRNVKNLKMSFRARPAGNKTSKPRRGFGDPVAAPSPTVSFVAVPAGHKMPSDLSYGLSGAVDPGILQTINSSGRLVFHSVGDTGDINGLGITRDLAVQMETQVDGGGNGGLSGGGGAGNPAFFYHLGDVVYYNGESVDYRDQFYDPYKFYSPVIFAIPGNHDGQTIINKGDPPDPEPSLTGFFANFCDTKRSPSQSSPYRYTMDQPWPYWVLNTPLANFIGLYSNVGGSLDLSTDKTHPQYSWLVSQLKQADKKKALILAVHHSPFSLDSEHGGYPDILDAIDQASAAAGGRYPDLVLSGHVHNYQRFHRQIPGGDYIHIVAGAGGYELVKTMHKLQLDPTNNRIKTPFKTTMAGVSLASYNEDLPGFLRITVDKQFIRGEYFVNDLSGNTQTAPAFDAFGFDYVQKKIMP